jgi:membrane protein YdbS with pleckstrin-like domain
MEVCAMPVSNPIDSPSDQANTLLSTHVVVAAEPRTPVNPVSVPTDDYPQVSVPPPAPLQGPDTPASEVKNEETLWEGRYSIRNFVGRGLVVGLLAFGWVALATDAWGLGHTNLVFWTYLLGVILVIYLALVGLRVLRAVRGHFYRLTDKRLFVTTGLFRRRVDQVELVRVKDIYLKQSMIASWLGLGNVVVISSEETLPQAILLGIEEPMKVMDLIWRATRAERDRRTTEINHI